MRAIALITALALAGCTTTPVPTGLTPPDPRLMIPPAPIADIPQNEGDPSVRAPYYASSRRDHGVCRDRLIGLQVYAKTVAPDAGPPKRK